MIKYNKEYYERLNNALENTRRSRWEHEQSIRNENKQRDKILDEQYTATTKLLENAQKSQSKINKIRKGLLFECLNNLYNKCLYTDSRNIQNNNIRNSIIENFINEQGTEKLINSFKSKNYILSEYYRIINKYTDIILESENSDDDAIEVEPSFRGKYHNDIDNDLNSDSIDTTARIIKNRVEGEVSKFINDNAKEEVEVKEMINKSQDKINKATDESIKESVEMDVRKSIVEIKNNRKRNIFGYMVTTLSEAAYTDKDLRKVYCNESGKLDVEGIVENVETIYTFLEMLNTTGIINIDKAYIGKVINGLKNK